MKLLNLLKIGRAKSVKSKSRNFYRDGLEEKIIGPIRVSKTSDGHIVERYTLDNGKKRFFATLAGTHWCANGDSIAGAVADAIWKDPERRPSMQELVVSVKCNPKHKFRVLTGACLVGCRSALAKAKRDESPMTAFDIRDSISREWGDKLISILGWEGIKS